MTLNVCFGRAFAFGLVFGFARDPGALFLADVLVARGCSFAIVLLFAFAMARSSVGLNYGYRATPILAAAAR